MQTKEAKPTAMTKAPATSAAAMVKGNAPTPQALLKADLERASSAFAAMLPRHVTVERLIKVVLSATARDEKLLECTRASIVRAVMQSAELGLELGGVLGEAYLVPYKRSWKDVRGKWHSEKQAQCIPGYRGFVKLARNGGVVAVHAHPVHAKDHFKVDLAEQKIEHSPDLSDDPGTFVAVYAVARLPNGVTQVDFMRKAEVEAIRRRSKTWDSETDTNDGPWATDYAEMARKTVVRRLAKYLPLSPELARALEHEAEIEDRDGHRAAALDVLDTHTLPDEPKPRALALAEEINAKAEAKPDEPSTQDDASTAPTEPPKDEPASSSTSADASEGTTPAPVPAEVLVEDEWAKGEWVAGWHGAPAREAFADAVVRFKYYVAPDDRDAAREALDAQVARLTDGARVAKVLVEEVVRPAAAAASSPASSEAPKRKSGKG